MNKNEIISKLNAIKGELADEVKGIDKNTDGTYKLDIQDARFSKIDALKSQADELVKQLNVIRAIEGTELNDYSLKGIMPDNTPVEGSFDAFAAKFAKYAENGMQNKFKGAFKLDMQITTPYNTSTGPVGVLLQPTRLNNYLPTVQGIINAWTAGASANNVDWLSSVYLAETIEHNNAAIVAEKGVIPQSDFSTGEVQISLVNVSHIFDMTKQQIQGVKRAEQLITQRGIQMLNTKIDNIFLNNNTAAFRGLNHVVGSTATSATDATLVDVVLDAIINGMAFETMPDTIILNQVKWGSLSKLKDTQGRYLLSDPSASGATKLWGIPLVADSQQPLAKVWVGDLSMNVEKFVYETGIEVDMTDSDDTKFQQAMKTLRLGSQIAAHTYRPGASSVITVS